MEGWSEQLGDASRDVLDKWWTFFCPPSLISEIQILEETHTSPEFKQWLYTKVLFSGASRNILNLISHSVPELLNYGMGLLDDHLSSCGVIEGVNVSDTFWEPLNRETEHNEGC